MIKRILLLTALLAPALAYGANPSNDFSVQILPAGSSGGGGGGGGGGSGGGGSPTPPAAALAGCSSANGGGPNNGSCFNTLVMNLDFTGATQSFVGNSGNFNISPLSNWLDCAGASSPKMFNTGQSSNANACRYSLVSDGGTNALLMQFLPGDWSTNAAKVTQMSTINNGSPASAGTTFPAGFYAEVKVRTTAASDAATSLETNDFWSYTGCCGQGSPSSEWDFIETYGSQRDGGGFVVYGYGSNGYYGGQQQANSTYVPGYNHDNYNIYGYRLTQDGVKNVAACFYVNNVQQSQTTGLPVCVPQDLTSSNHSVVDLLNTQLDIIMSAGPDNSTDPSAEMDTYVEWIHVYTCSNWAAANSLTTYGGNACAGTVLTTNP